MHVESVEKFHFIVIHYPMSFCFICLTNMMRVSGRSLIHLLSIHKLNKLDITMMKMAGSYFNKFIGTEYKQCQQ